MAQATLTILADVKKATSSIGELEKSSKLALGGIEKSFSALKVAAGAFIGVFAIGKIASGIKEITDAAAESENAIAGLNTALALSGEFSVEASQGFQDFAAEIQRTTITSEEAVLEQVKLAKSFGLTNEQAKKTVQAALELSAATGVSLESATTELAKTFSGTLGKSLSKSQQGFNQLSESALRAGGALDLALKAFGGSASAQANTFSGSLIQLDAAFGEIKETLGGIITSSPAVIEAISILKENFVKLNESLKQSDGGKRLLDSFLQISSVVVPALVKSIAFLAKAFVGFISLIEVSSVLINKVVTKFQVLTGVLSKSTGDALIESLNKNSEEVIKNYQVLYDTIEDVSKVSDGLAAALKKTSEGPNKTTEALLKTSKAVKDATDASDELTGSQKEQEAVLKGILAENKKISTEVANQGAEQNDIIANNLKLALDMLDVKQKELQSQGLLNDAIKDQIAAQKGLLSAKAREEILGQKAPGGSTDVRESRKDNQFISDDTIKTIGDAFGAGAGAIASSVSAFVTPLTSFMSAAEAVVGVAQKLIDFLPNLLNSIANVFKSLTALPQTLLEAFKNVFSSIGSFLGDFLGNLVSGLGEIILSAVTFLLEGIPNALIKLAETLPGIIAEAVPKLIDGLIKLLDNIGPLVERVIIALADAMPLIVDSLIDSLITRGGILKISYALAKALIVDVPIGLARGFANSLSSIAAGIFPGLGKLFSSGIKVPTPEWVSRLKIETPEWLGKFTASLNGGKLVAIFEKIESNFQALIDAIKGITGQGGTTGKLLKGDFKGVGNDISGGLKSLSPFASGGQVPSGFPNDTFPARLSSGENVIDRSLNERLSAYLDGGGSNTPVQIILKVGEQEMANIMYNLNRRGFRTA